MVAIFAGAGAGLERGSGATLGKAGLLGSSALGRGGEQLFVNAANGNLVINRQDEFLVGRGPDVAIARTYNSLADAGDDNNDQWRQSTDRRIFGLTGTVNTAGSTVKRVAGDGSVVKYTWSGGAYVTTDGGGAHDKLGYNSGTWTWVDGDSQITETYQGLGSEWRIVSQTDTSGNALSFTYNGTQLTRITSANGEYVDYTWSGSNITSIVTTAAGTLTRTRYTYDGSSRLSTVTVDLSPGDNSIADNNFYTTTYTYHGTSKQVASISQTDGSRVDLLYDGAGRVSIYTQTVASGVTRVTSFSYGADYTDITDPAGQVTRLDFALANTATQIATWTTANLSEQATTIGAASATKYTIVANGWAAATQETSVAVGDTVTWGLTLQAAGSLTSYDLGLYGDGGANWGTNAQSSARIVSGPGQLVQVDGGLWRLTGLSASQGTRVEITRTYTQAQTAKAYLYPDATNGLAGSAVVVADAGLFKSATATSLSSMNLLTWGRTGLGRGSGAGTIDGAPAYQLLVEQEFGLPYAATYRTFAVDAGETHSFSISLQAVGDGTSQSISLLGDTSGAGSNADATARIVFGPGTITQVSGGAFLVSGLSTTASTRIEITRRYTQSETGRALLHVDGPQGYRDGAELIVAAPYLVKRITEPATERRLVKITTPPPQSGGTAQVVQFAYNLTGDLTSVTDALNHMTGYNYDANGNLLTSTDRLGNIVARTYGSKNELLTESRTGSDSAGAANSHTTRYAYDSANRRVYSVTAEGQVTRYWYDSVGQLYFTSQFPEHFYDVSTLPASTAISQSQLDSWCGTLGPTTSSPITYTTFDARGNVEATRGYNVPDGFAWINAAQGSSYASFVYDQAGQLLSRTAAGQDSETFLYDGLGRVIASTDLDGGTTNFVFKDADMKTEVKIGSHLIQTSTYNKGGELVALAKSGDYVASGTASYQYDRNGRLRLETDATGRKIWHVYDAVGRKLADAREYDGTAALTEYRYDANDRLVATVHYVGALNASQVALLNDVATDPQIGSLRPTAYSSDLWTWQVYDSEGRVIEAIDGDGGVTAYSYDGSGRLVKTIGYATRLSPTVVGEFKTTSPTTAVLPATHADDGITRSFFDKDGRLIGVLDGEGYLSRTVYDRAGRKVEEVAFVAATGTSLRASGTFAQLLASVGTSTNDRRTRYVYDGQNHLRFTIDSLNQVTGYSYDSATPGASHDQVRTIIRYAEAISTLSSYTYTAVRDAVAALPSQSDNRTSTAIYDASGRLAYAVDPLGAVIGYSYDQQGRVTKTVRFATLLGSSTLPVASTDDRVTRNYYSDRGELRFTVDGQGYVTRFDYDAEGRLTREVRWDTAATVGDTTTIDQVAAVSGTWVDKQYVYHTTGQLASATDGEGATTVYTYYANGKLAYEYRAYGTDDVSITGYSYDKAGRLETRYDAYGTTEQTTTTYAYDAFGNIQSITDSVAATTRTYDELGQLLTESRGGVTTSYEYNAFGEAVKTTLADSYTSATSYAYYDQLGRVIVARDAESYLTETSYTLFGEVESVTRRYKQTLADASTISVPTAEPDPKDATTGFLYDKLGRVEWSTDAEGHYERYWYDAFGGRIQVRNKLGGLTGYSYYKNGQLRSEYVYAPVYDSAGGETAPGFYKTFNEYDARGNLNRVIEGLGLTGQQRDTYYTYDKADRLTRIDHPQVLFYDPATGIETTETPVSTFAYDKRGNVIAAVDANGARTLSYYDDLDRKTVEIDALGTYRSWSYDGNGNVLSEKVYGTRLTASTTPPLPAEAGGAAPQPPAGSEVRETTHTYDALNRLTTTSIASLRTGGWNGSAYVSAVDTVIVRSLEYNAQGNVILETDGNLNTIHRYFDRRGIQYAEFDQENYLTVWSLDAEGNIRSERRYATQLIGTPQLYGLTSPGTSTDDRVTMFEYDRNGRRTRETREAVGAEALTGTGTLTTTGADSVIDYHYNALGQVDIRTHLSGETVTSFYDNLGRLREEYRSGYTDHDGTPNVAPSVTYYYDALGNVTRVVQGVHNGGGAERVTTYAYGKGGRLRTVTTADGASRTMQRDKLGNVVHDYVEHARADGTTYLYSAHLAHYDLLGRVIEEVETQFSNNSWDGGPWRTTAYNAYGEVASTALGGVVQAQNKYDLAGRLWASSVGDGAWKLFGYDAAGHQNAVISSAGTNLASLSFEQALGDVANATINGTFMKLDKRGQAIWTIEEGRQLAASGSPADLNRYATYTAFGEVATETDARANTTYYAYTTMGRLKVKQSALVDTTSASGVTTTARATETYHYDREGRMIGRDDANGNRITWRYLAGTGLDGSEGLVTQEYHADGWKIETRYDRFGDAREIDNELNQQESRTYDGLGRVTSIAHRGGLLTDYYAYDELGRQTRHWNSVLGSANDERTDYDAVGRVISTRAFGGDLTTTGYVWSASIATTGIGTFGGWTVTTSTDADRASASDGIYASVEVSDLLGRTVSRTDKGGQAFSFGYDVAGRLVSETSQLGGEARRNVGYSYYNTGQVRQMVSGDTPVVNTDWSRKIAEYDYDAAGNLIHEKLVAEWAEYHPAELVWVPAPGSSPDTPPGEGQGYWEEVPESYNVFSNLLQDGRGEYDALGRITRYRDVAATAPDNVDKYWTYDLAGNVRSITTTYRPMLANGGLAGTTTSHTDWYRYDVMNRLVVTKGVVSGGTIVRGSTGTDLGYNEAGQRRTAQTGSGAEEVYSYNGAGLIQSVTIGGVTRATTSYDALGRVDGYIEYAAAGGFAYYRHSIVYDARSLVLSEKSQTRQGNDWLYAHTVNDYSATGAGSASGPISASGQTGTSSGSLLHHSETKYWLNGANPPVYGTPGNYSSADLAYADAYTANSYVWRDGAQQSQMVLTNRDGTSTSAYSYDKDDQLAQVISTGGVRPRSISYQNTLNGQVLTRTEFDNNFNQNDPRSRTYLFGGRELGQVSNNGTGNVDYATGIANRTVAPGTGAFRGGNTNATIHADFDSNFQALNGDSARGVGAYVVRAGDSLAAIAATLWGDASLWYKLAEANGLSGADALIPGRALTVPGDVAGIHHNAATFKPYDPAAAIGDTSPTNPQPRKTGNKCGAAGAILLTVIAVAVVAIIAPPLVGHAATATAAATGLTAVLGSTGAAIAGGAIAGAAGSIVSQGVGLATGIQDRFSFKQVALAGLSGAAGGLLQGVNAFGTASGLAKFGSDFARGALANAGVQGVGVLTGLQSRFDFAGVAIGGLVAGVGGAAGRGLTSAGIGRFNGNLPSLGDIANMALSGTAGAIAAGAARSLANGSSFGDNVTRALPDVIGSTIGNALAGFATSLTAPERRIQFAQAQTGDPNVASDHGTIIVTGTRMNWAQRLAYDTRFLQPQYLINLAINSRNWRADFDQINRTLADYNPVRLISYGGAYLADRAGFTGTARFLRSTGETYAGAQQGLGNLALNTGSGLVQLVANPNQALPAMGRSVVGAIDRALTITGREAAAAVIGEGSRLGSALVSGDPIRVRAASAEITETTVGAVIAVTPMGRGMAVMREAAVLNRVARAEAAAVRSVAIEGGGGARFGLATSGDYRATFLAANPGLEGRVVVHHAVERQALKLYPTQVTAAEIHSLENLRGIPLEVNSKLHLSIIRKEWNRFYLAHPDATKAQLLQQAAEIDKRYGSQFDPPLWR